MTKLNRYFRMRVLGFLLAAFIGCAFALEAQVKLPVTIVNGRECFYYQPQSSSETVYGLSKRLGLTREEIVAYNPGAGDGIRKNMTLYFPVADFRDRIEIEAEHSEAVVQPFQSEALRPVDMPAQVASETAQKDEEYRWVEKLEPDNTLKPVKVRLEIKPEDRNTLTSYTIAVLLPFALEAEEPGRQAKIATDFYKGILIAADTLSNRGDTIFISAYDTSAGLDDVLARPEVKQASVIVAPEDANFISSALRAGVNGYILNTLNFSDSLYLTEPQVVQTAVPHSAMYRKAVDNIISSLSSGVIPVIISNAEGRNDKEAFTTYLRERFAKSGIDYRELAYDGTLTTADLESLALPSRAKIALIPSAGSIGEFNRFSHALNTFRTANPEMEISLFGYPEWTTFRGDAQDMLHTLGATIYSRFNDDYTSFSARCIADDFIRWFDIPMIESIPSYGLLGYDLGCMLIKNLRSNKGNFNPRYPSEFRGIQSTFRLVQAGEDGGYVNDALYIIHYLPLTGTDVKIL